MLMILADALLSTSRPPGTLAAGANMLVRNMPLVILLAMLALLFWPSESESNADGRSSQTQWNAGRRGLRRLLTVSCF
jgi:hypothetical protein